MASKILLIQGHPDVSERHFGHALADAYARGAREAGCDVRSVDAIAWAEHVVLFFPLWLGCMPALVKGFLEQVARPGFALSKPTRGELPKKLWAGRSARIVVTMGMPALVYRWYFGAHSLKTLRRNILGFVGISPIRDTLVGSIEGLKPAQRQRWLDRLHALGQRGH